MCTGFEVAALAAVGASTAATVYSADQQRKTAHHAADQQRADLARADAEATQAANARVQQRRRALAQNSLVTGGGDLMSSGILNGGKPTLGG